MAVELLYLLLVLWNLPLTVLSKGSTWDVGSFTDQIERVVTMGGLDEADFYYPIVDESNRTPYIDAFPLIVFLQGGLVDKSLYSFFAIELASYGYVVVVPNHYQQIFQDVPQGLWASQWTPTEVLEDIKTRKEDITSPLYMIVNVDVCGISGHSNGGAAALFTTTDVCQFPFCFGSSSYTRPFEFQAVVVLGTHTVPFYGPPADPIDIENQIPVGLVNGDLDQMDSVCKSWQYIEEVKNLVIMKGVNHWGSTNIQNPPSNTAAPYEQTKSQEWSIEKSAYWTALLFDAYLKEDENALSIFSRNKGERSINVNRDCNMSSKASKSEKSSKNAKSGKSTKSSKYSVEFALDVNYEIDPILSIIDGWLQDNGLNSYGDPVGTEYVTDPLIDENTGKITPRFNYLMRKFPYQPWI